MLSTDDAYLERMGEAFEPHTVQLFRALVQPGNVVADVGANIGVTTLLFSDLGARVVSFEPSPSTFRLLKHNAELAGAQATLVNSGLGDRAMTSTITFSTGDRSGGFVSDQVQPRAGHITEQIRVVRLDDVWSRYADRLDFMKIDVEGFEGSVLKGASRTLRRHRPIVALELNHWCLNAFRRVSVPEFFDQLRAIFPCLWAVQGDNTDIKDLHDPDQAYHVMYHHIVHFRYPNIIGSFDHSIGPRLNMVSRHSP